MFKKIMLGILLLLVLAAVGFVLFVTFNYERTFDAPYPSIKASTDSALIARGKYLAYGPAHCSHCHISLTQFARVERGEEVPLSGGFPFKLPIGTIVTPNITPDNETGIGKLSDGEIARALRYGVRHDGRAIIDFMPFYDISDYDLTAIISFLRTQTPINAFQPINHDWNFMGKAVMALVMKPMGDGEVPPSPAPDSTAAFGKYLVDNVANCRGCHTNRDMMTGAYIGPDMAGPTKFEVFDLATGSIIEGKHIVAPNLTPDPETGRITDWTKQDFLARFRRGTLIPGTPMPWGPFGRMSDMELIAIWKYLQTLTPVKSEAPIGIQEGNP
ncbi:MAG: cytochrome C [Cyclobacteriaceae bacterium]|nr:cytochrome C [Cyclobacteriaceae bacterium]